MVTVNNLTPGTIAGAQTICENGIPAVLTTTLAPTGDGTVTIMWQSSINGTSFTDLGVTTPTYTSGALTQDTWYRKLVTSTIGLNACIDSTNIIKVTVNNFIPGSIDADQTICENTAPAPLTSVTPTGDGSFTYRWLSSSDGISYGPIASALSETYSPGSLAADTWYRREVKSTLNGKACLDTTNTVLIVVNNMTPGVIAGTQTICEGATPAPLTISTPESGDGGLSYLWKESTDGFTFTTTGVTTATYSPPALFQDTWFKMHGGD